MSHHNFNHVLETIGIGFLETTHALQRLNEKVYIRSHDGIMTELIYTVTFEFVIFMMKITLLICCISLSQCTYQFDREW